MTAIAPPPAPLPGFIGLTGDEDGGVALECRHPAHRGYVEQILYLGSSAPAGLAVAEDVNDLIRCAYVHAGIHPREV